MSVACPSGERIRHMWQQPTKSTSAFKEAAKINFVTSSFDLKSWDAPVARMVVERESMAVDLAAYRALASEGRAPECQLVAGSADAAVPQQQ